MEVSIASERTTPALPQRMIRVALVLLAVVALAQLQLAPEYPLTRGLMQRQDAPVLAGVAALLVALAGWVAWGGTASFADRIRLGRIETPLSISIILAAAVVVALGTSLVALDHPWTYDEFMAVFDAQVFATGRLIAPVPPEWRPFVPALVPAFLLPVPGHEAWISSYLPVNGGIRALLGLALPPPLVNGMLVAVALLALVGCTRRLLPHDAEARIVALILAATSAQVLCMGMTPWAMTAHLTLNLVWLHLFLMDKPMSHAAAFGIGFLATGLHQIIFHPLFAAPFVLQLLLERRWRLASVYVAGYGAIGAVWVVYWQLVLAGAGFKAQQATAVGLPFLLERVASLLANFNASAPETMLQNLMRFAAWQSPLLLILVIPGAVAAWRAKGPLRSAAAGFLLTVVAMTVLLPYQDSGWGYRYVHGLIGSVALLAGVGWSALRRETTQEERRSYRFAAGVLSGVAVLVLLPVHLAQMHGTIAPYAHASSAIAARQADFVVIETVGIYYGDDLVHNDPFLRNRPLTFDIGRLEESLVMTLCARGSVSLFGGGEAERFGLVRTDPAKHPEYERIRALRALIESDACRRALATR